MLYLGIDQHHKQITVCVRDESGAVVLRRQVSTRPDRVESFLREVRERSAGDGYRAIVEVCGFNDWLLATLPRFGCRDVVLIHPDKRSKRKTDRRDAAQLAELLWLNRDRLAAGERPQGLRRVVMPTADEQRDRQLTALRKRLGQQRTRTINKIKNILRRHNLTWEQPTKTFETKSARRWLEEMQLSWMDRLEMNHLLAQWDLWEKQLEEVNQQIAERFTRNESALLLSTAPGAAAYTALAIASRIGSVERFPGPRSLANYFGLTPGCRNSGEAQDRLGRITKQGSNTVRFLLGQMVKQVLDKDREMRRWYLRIRRRRGSKIARVAVMRRLTTIFWHMLKHREPYCFGGPREVRRQRTLRKERPARRPRLGLDKTRRRRRKGLPTHP